MVDNIFIELTNAYALLTLRYGGLTFAILGVLRWSTAKKSTENSKQGFWLVGMGVFMFIAYVVWDSFMKLALWFIGNI